MRQETNTDKMIAVACFVVFMGLLLLAGGWDYKTETPPFWETTEKPTQLPALDFKPIDGAKK